MSDSPVVVGEISGLYGVHGWVKVFSHTDPRTNIVKYNPWLLKQGDRWKSVNLLNGRQQGKTIVAQIEGVNDREQAFAMIGIQIAIDQSQLKSLGENDFYWRELEGLQVVNMQAEVLGKVSHLMETGANDVLVVKLEKDLAKELAMKEMLIPYILDDVIKTIDLDAKKIEVDWDGDYI